METEVVWRPQPGPQTLLVSCPVDEIFYGGAAGGGKTDGLLGKFMAQAFAYPGQSKGLFLRRSFPELEQVIARSKEIYTPLGWTWREKDRTWSTNDGSFMRMRFIDREIDHTKYQGHDYSLILVDEAGNFPDPSGLDKLKARLRSASGVPCQFVLAANPGGAGHGWIKQRYVDPGPPLVPFEADENGMSVQRVFIPAKVTDNLILMRNDPGYVNRLHMVGDSVLVRAWLHGDWNVQLGQYFMEWLPSVHVIPERNIPKHWLRFRSFDWGAKVPFCVHWYAVADGSDDLPAGALVLYREWYGATAKGKGLDLTAREIAAGIIKREESEHVSYGVADYQIFRSEGGPSIAEEMAQLGVYWRSADKERIAGLNQIRQRLKGSGYGGDDWRPMLYVFCTAFALIRQMPLQIHDEKDPEDCMKARGIADHAVDTLRYACMSRSFARKQEQTKVETGWSWRSIMDSMTRKKEERLGGY